MTLCEIESKSIVTSYRSMAPPGYDPQCIIATATLVTVAIIAAVVAAGTSAYASYASAQSQEDAAKFNQAVARNNASAAAGQAQFQADAIRDRNRRVLAMQRSSWLKSGGDLSGTANDLAMDSSINGEMDALSAIYTGRVSQGNQTSQSRLFGMQANSAGAAQGYGTAASGISGLAGAASIGASGAGSLNNPNFRGNG